MICANLCKYLGMIERDILVFIMIARRVNQFMCRPHR